MKHIRCVGVPEHFNLPWHLAIESGRFKQAGVTLLWSDEPKGTGAMCEALREGSTDIAIMVATGSVRECLRNDDVKVIGTYVDSPLTWGVHVPAGCPYQSLADIRETRFAISRFNSGSHLTAYLLASQQNWELNENSFEVIHDLNGARKRFSESPDLLFLWEKFTTDFLVQLGEFRLIDEVTPPWPCFLIVARKQVIEENKGQLKLVLNCIQAQAAEFMADPNTHHLIAKRYGLSVEQAKTWRAGVVWNTNGGINAAALASITDSLNALKILAERYDEKDLIERIIFQF